MKKTGMDKLFDKYVKRIQSGDTKAMNEIALIFQNNYESGVPRRVRTYDPLIKSQMLYQLS